MVTQLFRRLCMELKGFVQNRTFKDCIKQDDEKIIDIIVYTNDSNPFIINCQKYNSSVILENPDDIVYLYRLAQDTPLLYAELALKADGFQGYVDAMNEFN